MSKFVNLTPHEITLTDPESPSRQQTIPPSGVVARVKMGPAKTIGVVDGIPVQSMPVAQGVEGMPDRFEPDTFYLVSLLVIQAVKHPQVVAPSTGPNDGAIRNEKGHVVAVTRLTSGVE